MLDNVSAIQFFLAIAFVMALIALCAKGALHVYHMARRRIRRWRVSPLKKECAVPTYARLVSSRPQPSQAPKTAGRAGPRLARAGQQSDYSPYVEDGLYTRVVRFPQDIA